MRPETILVLNSCKEVRYDSRDDTVRADELSSMTEVVRCFWSIWSAGIKLRKHSTCQLEQICAENKTIFLFWKGGLEGFFKKMKRFCFRRSWQCQLSGVREAAGAQVQKQKTKNSERKLISWIKIEGSNRQVRSLETQFMQGTMPIRQQKWY